MGNIPKPPLKCTIMHTVYITYNIYHKLEGILLEERDDMFPGCCVLAVAQARVKLASSPRTRERVSGGDREKDF